MGINSAVRRALDPSRLDWPSEEDAASDSLEANHDYVDLRGVDWPEVDRILAQERDAVARLLRADDPEAEWKTIANELSAEAEHVADIIDGPLYGLEPGVASAVLALSALGAIPFWSDGGSIHEDAGADARPQVRFFALPEHIETLLAAAEHANVSLEPDAGRCVAHAETASGLMDFAEALLRTRRV